MRRGRSCDDGRVARASQAPPGWGAVAILGGLTWIPVRIGVSVSYVASFMALDYVTWNRLMVVPLGLMLAAVVGLFGSMPTRAARTAAGIATVGLAAMMTGVVVEFFVFGGLAGNREGASAGWLVYLLGLAVHVIGLLAMGVATWGSPLGWLAPLIAVLHAGWLPAGLLEGGFVLMADQVGIGVAWAALGLVWVLLRTPPPWRDSSPTRRGRTDRATAYWTGG